jgi:hypothetical protein
MKPARPAILVWIERANHFCCSDLNEHVL